MAYCEGSLNKDEKVESIISKPTYLTVGSYNQRSRSFKKTNNSGKVINIKYIESITCLYENMRTKCSY